MEIGFVKKKIGLQFKCSGSNVIITEVYDIEGDDVVAPVVSILKPMEVEIEKYKARRCLEFDHLLHFHKTPVATLASMGDGARRRDSAKVRFNILRALISSCTRVPYIASCPDYQASVHYSART